MYILGQLPGVNEISSTAISPRLFLPILAVITNLNGLIEDTGTSAWYHELPASPVSDQISLSSPSLVSLIDIVSVPIPLPNIWVQNRRHNGVSGPK